MENDRKLCEEIIKEVRKYLDRKDYNGLTLYLEQKEKEIEYNDFLFKNKEEKYIDSLVDELK